MVIAMCSGRSTAGAEIANSVTGFSSTQGLNGWQYGRLNGSTFTQFGSYVSSNWSYASSISPSYFIVGSTGAHPSDNDTLGLATRRWTSGTSGFLTLSGSYALGNSAGSVRTSLRINGQEALASHLASTTAARTYSFSVPITTGDTIDLVVSANGTNATDSTNFNLVVSNDLANRVVLANSMEDFTTSQNFSTHGHGAWSYGNYGTANDPSSFSTANWSIASGDAWKYSSATGIYQYEQQTASLVHPGDPSTGNTTTIVPVRRWVSDVTGKVYLDGFWSKVGSSGDGVVTQIRSGTLVLQSGTIAGTDYAQRSFPAGMTIDVVAGQAIDFILGPRANWGSDSTYLNASITADAYAGSWGWGWDDGTFVGTGGLVTLPAGTTLNRAVVVRKGTLKLAATGNVGSSASIETAGGTGFDISGISTTSLTIAALSGSAASTVSLGAKTLVVNGSGTSTFSGCISGTGGLSKQGTGRLLLDAPNTFTGSTSIEGGTLALGAAGSLASAAIRVADGACFDVSAAGLMLGSGQSIGGSGTIVGNLVFGAGSRFFLTPGDPSQLSVTSGSTSFASTFGVADVLGLDGSTAEGTYTLLTGPVDFTNVINVGARNAVPIGAGKTAYFQSGSLQLVVVPEPGAAMLAGIGIAAAAWRIGRRGRAVKGGPEGNATSRLQARTVSPKTPVSPGFRPGLGVLGM